MENTKKCIKCGIDLPLSEFYKKKLSGGRVGYESYCKTCRKAIGVKWRQDNPGYAGRWNERHREKRKLSCARWLQDNPEKARAAAAKWQKNNPDKKRIIDTRWRKNNLEKVNARVAKWRKNNLEKVRAAKNDYEKERKAADPGYKLMKNIRTAMNTALKHGYKAGHTTELLGCSIEYLRHHLENQFTEGMTWDNYGRHGWHIDHIIPVSYFDHNDPEQQRRTWHYTNLQPLWAIDNLRKSNKIKKRQFMLLEPTSY
jgi:hypothetical protein